MKKLLLLMLLAAPAGAQECGPVETPPETPPVTEQEAADAVIREFAWVWGPMTLTCVWESLEPPLYRCGRHPQMLPGSDDLICSPSGQCVDD